MPSLGELFISLGFDVDEAKLKNFQTSLKDTHDIMNRLGKTAAETVGVLGTAFGGLTLFVQNSADTSTKLGNMALMFAANAQQAQTFANALHHVNSLVSTTQGLEIFGKFSQVVTGQVPLGSGQGAAISLLGGYQGQDSFLGTSADEVISKFAKNYDVMKKQWGSAYGVWLDRAGVGAAAEPVIAQRAHDLAAYNAESQYNMTDKQIEDLRKYGQSTAEFHNAIDKFENTISASLAPDLIKFFDGATKLAIALDHFNTEHPAIAEAEGVGGAIAGTAGALGLVKKLFGAGSAVGAVAGGLSELGIIGLLASAPWVGSWAGAQIAEYIKAHRESSVGTSSNIDTRGGRNNNLGNIKYGTFAQNHGAIGQDAGGFAIFPDQETGTNAIGALLSSVYAGKGIDTIAGIISNYTKGDSPATQLAYMNMLSSSTGRGINEHLNLSDPAVIQQLVNGIIKQENGIKNFTINVHSNATDNQQVAQLVVKHVQTMVNTANAQTNLGY